MRLRETDPEYDLMKIRELMIPHSHCLMNSLSLLSFVLVIVHREEEKARKGRSSPTPCKDSQLQLQFQYCLSAC